MRFLAVLFMFLLFGCATRPPTNTELAAAMAFADTVFILRLDELRDEESPEWNSIATFSVSFFDKSSHPASPAGIEETISQSLPTSRPSIFVLAHFRSTPASSSPRSVLLWWTAHPLDDLQHKLDHLDSGVTQRSHFDGVPLYCSDSTPTRPYHWCVAILERHSLLVTSDRSDMESLITSIRARNPRIPEQWRAASADIVIDSPLLILRSLRADHSDPIHRSPILPTETHNHINSFSVTSPRLASKTLYVRTITPHPPRETSYSASGKFLGLIEIWNVEWTIRPFAATNDSPSGFHATLSIPSTESMLPAFLELSGLLW